MAPKVDSIPPAPLPHAATAAAHATTTPSIPPPLPHVSNQPPQRKPVNSSWADKLRASSSKGQTRLHSTENTVTNGILEIPNEDLDLSDIWERNIVGFFPGPSLPLFALRIVAMKEWAEFGLESVSIASQGFFLFRFPSVEMVNLVLEKGPWSFGGRAILLQQWTPSFVFDRRRISKLPVWIQLHDLPFPLWSVDGLSRVTQQIGKPLFCDKPTSQKTRLSYARVCVELDASQPPLTEIMVRCSSLSSDPLQIGIEYEWKPKQCLQCRVFGHVCPQVAHPDKGLDKGKAPATETDTEVLRPTVAPIDRVHTRPSPTTPRAVTASTVGQPGAQGTVGEAGTSSIGPPRALIMITETTPLHASQSTDVVACSSSPGEERALVIRSAASDDDSQSLVADSDVGSLSAIERDQDTISGFPLCSLNREMSPPAMITEGTETTAHEIPATLARTPEPRSSSPLSQPQKGKKKGRRKKKT